MRSKFVAQRKPKIKTNPFQTRHVVRVCVSLSSQDFKWLHRGRGEDQQQRTGSQGGNYTVQRDGDRLCGVGGRGGKKSWGEDGMAACEARAPNPTAAAGTPLLNVGLIYCDHDALDCLKADIRAKPLTVPTSLPPLSSDPDNPHQPMAFSQLHP